LNDLEYIIALLLRSAACALFPRRAETVEISFHGRTQKMRLLSGVAMNFPVRALPFDPGVRVEDEALSIHLIPYGGRLWPFLQLLAPQKLIGQALHIRLEAGQRAEILLTDREAVEFFLDEDPVRAYGRLTLEVAGSLAFVPGPLYPSINEREADV
jgi:hypothetical protein